MHFSKKLIVARLQGEDVRSSEGSAYGKRGRGGNDVTQIRALWPPVGVREKKIRTIVGYLSQFFFTLSEVFFPLHFLSSEISPLCMHHLQWKVMQHARSTDVSSIFFFVLWRSSPIRDRVGSRDKYRIRSTDVAR